MQPQELEVYYILPALRRELAKILKQNGKSQKEIAKMFGVTEPAVSQYLHQKRGADVQFTPEFQHNITNSAKQITDNQTFLKATQQLLQHIWGNRFICTVCHDQNGPAIPKDCAVCFG